MDTRTALGITVDNKIILLVTQNIFFSTLTLAELMQKPQEQGGLDCIEAVNLDGGHSTQIYATLPDFSLNISNSSNVADAILVIPKQNVNDHS